MTGVDGMNRRGRSGVCGPVWARVLGALVSCGHAMVCFTSVVLWRVAGWAQEGIDRWTVSGGTLWTWCLQVPSQATWETGTHDRLLTTDPLVCLNFTL